MGMRLDPDNVHRNGTYSEPKGRSRDGYEDDPRVPRTTAQLDELRRGIARDLDLERLRASLRSLA